MEDPRIISALFIFLKMAYYNVLINTFYYNVISLLFQYIYNESDVFLSNKYLSFTLFFQFLYKIIIHKSLILSFQRAKKELPLNSRNSS